jgi:hypothetical protein
MTARQIIIKCLDENTDVTCRNHPCDKPEKEGNTGKCCHKCSLEILREYESKIYNKAIGEVMKKAKEIQEEQIRNLEQSPIRNGKRWAAYMNTYLGHIQVACKRLIKEQLKGNE